MSTAKRARKPAAKTDALAEGVLAGDRRALARAITLIESTRADHRRDAAQLLEALLPRTGRSIRLGISGVPGVGKSTFIEVFGLKLIEAGHRVAVLAVDPSSQRSGGSILGDKTRMPELATAEAAFIRPSPTRGTLGGVARRSREAMLATEAAGFDVVIVETVGVGQSETAVAEMVDLFLLLIAPGGGDELQGIKRGIMEIADRIVVNTADGKLTDEAGRTAAEYQSALQLLRPRSQSWTPPVLLCSALTGTGVPEIWEAVTAYREALEPAGEISARRSEQARQWLWQEVQEGLMAALQADPVIKAEAAELEARVVAGELPATAAAQELLKAFLDRA